MSDPLPGCRAGGISEQAMVADGGMQRWGLGARGGVEVSGGDAAGGRTALGEGNQRRLRGGEGRFLVEEK